MPSSPKGGESDITIANAESSGKRRKLARAPIPCKHLQWICELFKRLNSLKNLVCTGVVCHRLRHPAPPSSMCQRHAGGSFLPQTTKTPPPDPFRPRRSLTLCISNNWYSSQCKETDDAPFVLPPHFLPARCRTNNTGGKSEEITATRINLQDRRLFWFSRRSLCSLPSG